MIQRRFSVDAGMPWHFGLFLVLSLGSCLPAQAGSLGGVPVQDKNRPRAIKRVKRPVFKRRDWDGIYFENLFRDGLVGARPEKLAPGQSAPMVGQAGSVQPGSAAGTGAGAASRAAGWSEQVSASTLEDEVKTLQQRLASDITTPSKFKADYLKVHQSYSLLSMLFAVIREYDKDVRWKKFSPEAQASFERAAANSRVGTSQAYESCKRRGVALQDMVRGGSFVGTEKPPEKLDWSTVVGHSPIMVRLQVSFDRLKQNSANENEFKRNLSMILHESEMVAMMAKAVQQENMEYAEEEGYVEFAKQMQTAATKAAEGCRTNDFDSVSAAVNAIGQSCSNCHDEWR